MEKKSNQILLIILLSLIFHALFFLLFFTSSEKNISFLKKQEKKIEKKDFKQDVAALKPKRSPFGAPVIIQSETPPEETKKPKKIIKEKKVEPKHKKESVEEIFIKPEDIPQITKERTVIAETPKEEGKKTTDTEKVEQLKKVTPKMEIKKQLTFASLAKGFIENIEDKGTDWIERTGNPNIRPDQKEFKYISYMQKFTWHLQSVMKSDPNPLRLDIHEDLKTLVEIEINKNGELVRLKVLMGTGIKIVDDKIIEVFEKASPFPPLPNHFNKDYFRIPYLITILSPDNPCWRFYYK